MKSVTVWADVKDPLVLARLNKRREIESVSECCMWWDKDVVNITDGQDDIPTIPTPTELSEKYTWDYCLVFDIGSETETHTITKRVPDATGKNLIRRKEDITERTWFRQETARIVQTIEEVGLRTFLFYSVQKDELFCLIGLPQSRAMEEADRIGMELQLEVQPLLDLGKAINYPLAIKCADSEMGLKPEDYFSGLYGRFRLIDEHDDQHDLRSNLYTKTDQGAIHGMTPFHSVLRLKLCASILEADHVVGGAELKLKSCAKNTHHPLDAAYPLHNDEELIALRTKTGCCRLFWPPVIKIKDYIGEQFGFYFSFLGWYSTWLIPVSIVGLLFFIWQLSANRVDVSGIAAWGIIMGLWATLFMESWKRRQSRLCRDWGMWNFLRTEVNRSEFVGHWTLSPITGRYEEMAPFYQVVFRKALSASVVTSFIFTVAAALFVVILFRGWLAVLWNTNPQYPLMVASIINSAQIQILNLVYSRVAVWLNDFENHRTETAYENALIEKTFLFKSVNSYQSLYYIAFIKRYDSSAQYCTNSNQYLAARLTNAAERTIFLGGGNSTWQITNYTEACGSNPTLSSQACHVLAYYKNPSLNVAGERGDCLYELAFQLCIVFGVQILTSHAITYISARLQAYQKRKHEMEDREKSGDGVYRPSPAEKEYVLPVYDDPFDDYDGIMIQFGYVVLFVVAFPLAPLLALVNNIVEVRSDWVLLFTHSRRAHPAGASDIGTWQSMLSLLAWVGLATNIALITITSTELLPDSKVSLAGRLALFLGAEHFCFAVKATLAYMIPDTPADVTAVVARNELINDIFISPF